MEKDSSPLDTLRQLKDLLDSGAITPQEFETLKGRLLATPTVPLNPAFNTPEPPVAAVGVRPEPVPPVGSAGEDLPPLLDFFKQPQTSASSPPPPPVAPVREEKPSQPPAPPAPTRTAPVAPATTPEFFPPRAAAPPTPPAAATAPRIPSPPLGAPAPAASAPPPDFFPPKTQAAPPIVPSRPVEAAPSVAANPRPTPASGEAENVGQPARSSLGTILAIGGGLLLLWLIWYLVMGQSRPSEHLTSISQTAADTVAIRPETGPQAEQLELPPVAAPETVRVAPIVPPAADSVVAAKPPRLVEPTPASQPAISPAAPQTVPVAAESADEATTQVRDVLAAYYADMQAAPFSADQHFAPQVELFIIQRNTTPAAINAWLDENRFAEFKDAEIQVEPGSLRVSPAATDGSRVVTYIERGRAFRPLLQKNQYTRAQMRLRVNADYKIIYQKQERLLENTLSDVTPQ